MRLARGEGLLDVVRASTAKDDDVKQGVRAKTVGTVNGDTGSLTGGVETGDNLVLAVLVNRDDLASVLRRDTAHYQDSQHPDLN